MDLVGRKLGQEHGRAFKSFAELVRFDIAERSGLGDNDGFAPLFKPHLRTLKQQRAGSSGMDRLTRIMLEPRPIPSWN